MIVLDKVFKLVSLELGTDISLSFSDWSGTGCQNSMKFWSGIV